MKLIKVKDYQELSKKAAGIIAANIILKPDCVLGLATGSSPVGTYQELATMYERGELDFSQVTSVNLDEYVGLDGSSDQSYRYFMNKNLFEKVNIPMGRTFVPDGSNLDEKKACADYEEILKKTGPADLQLLGIGVNGHIGFNEPSDAFAASTHCVELTEETIQSNKRFFQREEDVPKKAYSMGIGNIMNAKMVLLVANGKNKAQAVAQMIQGPVTPKMPASILQFHPNVVVIADEEALSMLS
ncbi:MAG: glucosamine-6-phosphate deaminase [Eubacteriales bacterium]|nr:glucosamine-6-phosphate deaminase [Eubacteriales bacterium]